MNEDPLRPGTLVRSLAGRDMGSCYVVIKMAGDRLAIVADGGVRTVDRPKTKNGKHLMVIGTVDQTLRARLERGERVTDGDIHQAIRVITHANQEGEGSAYV